MTWYFHIVGLSGSLSLTSNNLKHPNLGKYIITNMLNHKTT